MTKDSVKTLHLRVDFGLARYRVMRTRRFLRASLRQTDKGAAMPELPKDVVSIKLAFTRESDHALNGVSKKLFLDTPELVAMWCELECWKNPQDPPTLWVIRFLYFVKEASSLLPFHYMSLSDRHELGRRIEMSADDLVRKLEVNGLDGHLFHGQGLQKKGFFIYEDVSEAFRASVDAHKLPKVKLSVLIKQTAKRAKDKIASEATREKVGDNLDAVRFIRRLAAKNTEMCGRNLDNVIATATNAIFGTHYTESDVANLLSA